MKKRIVLILLALTLLAASFVPVFYVRDDAGGTVFWQEKEAYLCLGDGHTGYHFSSLRYPFVAIGEYFHVIPSPANQRVSMIVIHVTLSEVERAQMDSKGELNNSDAIVPFDDGFYAICEGSVLCKWAGNRYRPATEEEQHRIGGVNRMLSLREDLKSGFVNGWHARNMRRLPGDHFEADIVNLVISVKNLATNPRAYPWFSVQLLRPGQTPESLYNVDGTPRRVSKPEYEHTFSASDAYLSH
jgi:hypothetical protein